MKIKNILKHSVLVLLGLILIPFCYFFVWFPSSAKDIIWGVTFSQRHAQALGLDWKQSFLAMLDDLKVRNLRLIAYWDRIEPEKGKYDFNDLDWQISEASARGAKIIIVMGLKTPRWPECHMPQWAAGLPKKEQQENILNFIKQTILRYQAESSVRIWQVENEPFFSFGECPWTDENFLNEEIKLVKSLDKRQIIISDSGEMSFWFKAAKAGDIVGTTIYRKIWSDDAKMYFDYPLPPVFYNRKAQVIEKLFHKEVICVELQAEPWGPLLLYDSSLNEQMKTMNPEQFKKNVEFARKTGIKEFYLWGAEWWYWLKEKQNLPQIWDEAKNLFGAP